MKKTDIAIARICNSFNMAVPEVAQLSQQHDQLLDEIEKSSGAKRKKLVDKAGRLRAKINTALFRK